MPWKSDKQRRWAHATGQPWAKEWDNKYATGGNVMGLLDKRDQDMKITVKKSNGSSVTYHSPEGSQVDMNGILGGMVEGPDMGPTADNVTARLTPGEYVINRPAAQKYKGLLQDINNEGRQMLAMGGYAKPMMGYANGGMVNNPLYGMLQEDYDYIEEMVRSGRPIGEIVDYYVHTWQLQGTPEERSIIRSVVNSIGPIGDTSFPYTQENPNQGYGYATDSDPITASANPAAKASEWARRNNVDFTDYNLEKLEQLVKEAVSDWSTLPEYERREWGSIDELIEYYLEDGSGEYGIRRGGYAEGGMVGGMDLANIDIQKADMIIKEMVDQGANTGLIAGALADEFGVDATDYNLQKIEEMVKEYLRGGQPMQGYWTGGEVGKGNPEEGDTANHLGSGFGGIVYRQGQWVYDKSGNPVQKHILKKISDYAGVVAGMDEGEALPGEDPSGGADLMGSQDELAGGVPELKEAEGKNYGWAQRAIAAEKIIRELEDDPEFNAAGAAIGKQEWISNLIDPTSDLFRSEKGQRYRRAVEAFTAAILRKDTGAQVNNQELTRTARTFFADLGTSAAAKTDLRNQRASVIESFIAASGPRAGDVTQLAEESLGEGWRNPKGVEEKPLLTGEDWGGVAGGTAGAIAGGVVGGPLGAALGGAGGAYIGRAIGQYATTDDDILASITPEVNDIIDTALSGVGGGALKVGSTAYKAAKAAIARRMAREGTSTADEVSRIADDIAKGGIIKGASGATSRLAAQVSGRVPADILESAAQKGFTTEVAHGGKPFLVNHNTGRVIDGLTGSLLPKTTKVAKDVLAKLPKGGGF